MKEKIFKAEVLPKKIFYLKYFIELFMILFTILAYLINSTCLEDNIGQIILGYFIFSIILFFKLTFSSKIVLNKDSLAINDTVCKKGTVKYTFKMGATLKFNSLVLLFEDKEYYIPIITSKSRRKADLLVRFIDTDKW